MISYTLHGHGTPRKFNFFNAPLGVLALGRLDKTSGQVIPLGTCFALDKLGIFATASHVIGGSDEGLVVIANEKADHNDYQTVQPNILRCFGARLIAQDPIHDLAVIQSDEYQIRADSTRLENGADDVTIGMELMSYGYPHLDSGRLVLTRHDFTVGAKVLIPSPVVEAKYMVLNFLARPGQSGSPIFRCDNGALVGILSGAFLPAQSGMKIMGQDPAALHQTTHAVSAEYLKGMY